MCSFFLSRKYFCTHAFCLVLQFWFHLQQQTASHFIHKTLKLVLPVLWHNKMFLAPKNLSIYMTRFSPPGHHSDVNYHFKAPQKSNLPFHFLHFCSSRDDPAAVITHLPSFLLIPSKELANLIHETRSLLPASQPWGACSSHSVCWSSEPESTICTACQRPSQYSPVSALRTPQQASQ